MDECIRVLETSLEALSSDNLLCQLIWNQRVAEEVSGHFSIDNSLAGVTMSDPVAQYALKGFKGRLEL
jgi:hypothetical protein